MKIMADALKTKKPRGIYTKAQRKFFHEAFSAIMQERDLRDVDVAEQLMTEDDNKETVAVRVGRWRNGNNMPDSYNLLGLASVLGIDVSQLIGSNPWSEYLNKLLKNYEPPHDPDAYTIKVPVRHADDINKAALVLESNTHYSVSLHMNITSFHEAIETIRREQEREISLKKDLQADINKKFKELEDKLLENRPKRHRVSPFPTPKPELK